MKKFSTVYSSTLVTGLVTGLVLSSASVLIAGPIGNASFETGPLGQGGLILNDWGYIASSGSVGFRANSFGAYVATDGTNFSFMAAQSGSVFLQSAAFTVVNANATIQFDYFFEGTPGATSIGTFTSTGGGGITNFALPSPTVSSGGAWQTLAPVVIPQGEWLLTFLISNPTGDSVLGLDNISVVDNPVIPLPTGAAMAVVGMGVIGIRRRRN